MFDLERMTILDYTESKVSISTRTVYRMAEINGSGRTTVIGSNHLFAHSQMVGKKEGAPTTNIRSNVSG